MIRNDIYCLYKGKEFRFVHKADGTYQIVTSNELETDKSFICYKNKVYQKQVTINEIEEVYSISSFAVYNGEIFSIIRPFGDSLELVTSNIELAQENNMKQIGKSEFSKVVSKLEVEIFEEKKPLKLK